LVMRVHAASRIMKTPQSPTCGGWAARSIWSITMARGAWSGHQSRSVEQEWSS